MDQKQKDGALAASSAGDAFPLIRRYAKTYIFPHHKMLLLALLLMVMAAGLTAAMAKYMEPIIDDVFTDKGIGGITNNSSDIGTFKIPTLRNIEFFGLSFWLACGAALSTFIGLLLSYCV